MKNQLLLILAFTLFNIQVTLSQPGNLDLNFDADGVVTTDIGDFDRCYSVIMQPDNKIIAAGVSDMDIAVVRYNPDGSPDNTFGVDGRVIITIGGGYSYGKSLALQPDGKILVAGHTRVSSASDYGFFVVRLNTDGTLDNTFSVDGKVITSPSDNLDYAYSMTLQPDGKIILAGDSDSDIALARYNADGTLDISFNENGIVCTAIGSSADRANSVIIQPDNKIVAAGYTYVEGAADIAVLRYNNDGTLDNTFGNNGITITTLGDEMDVGEAAVLQPDGKILVAGNTRGTSNDFVLLRYNSNGTLDNSFGDNGIVITDFSDSEDIASDMILQPDGKILVVGSTWGESEDFAVIRYNSDGTPDQSFGNDGIVTTDYDENLNNAQSVVLQSDGKIVVAGYSSPDDVFTVARYLSGLSLGIAEFSEQNNTLLIYPNPVRSEVTLQYELTEIETIGIGLYDMQGRLVQTFISQEKRSAGKHEEILTIDLSIPEGTYILSIRSHTGKQSILINKN